MTNTTKILYLSISLLFFACNQIKSKKNEQDLTKQINVEKDFDNKLKKSPKLFSKFWVNMNEVEFDKTVDILKKEKKIEVSNDSLFYIIDGYTMYLERFFKKGELKKIKLSGALEPFPYNEHPEWTPYNIFKEKYKLSNLTTKEKYYKKNTVPNLDYSPIYVVNLKNNISEKVPNSLIDNNSNQYDYYKKNEIEDLRLALSKKSISINKNNNIIIMLNEVPSIRTKEKSTDYIDVVYSLDDLKQEIPFAIKNKYRIGPNEINFVTDDYKSFSDQKSMETIGNYLVRKNSKYVTQLYYQDFDLEVIYITKEYYNQVQSDLMNDERKEKELMKRIEQLNKNESSKKKKESLDEI